MRVKNTEQKLKTLEDEAKALKSAYSVYGGLMQFYITESETFSRSIYSRQLYQIRFTPSLQVTNRTLTELRIAEAFWTDEFWTEGETLNVTNFMGIVNTPQAGDGTVIADVFLPWPVSHVIDTLTIKFIAYGPSPGTFEWL